MRLVRSAVRRQQHALQANDGDAQAGQAADPGAGADVQGIHDLFDDLRLHVVHTLLAHHGELEFGSPKLPMTKEALFLHMLDDLDAKLAGFSAIIEATPDEDEFSAYASAYGRHLYARGIHQEE